ncbi:threonine--tRNA ligase [Candidatus Woesearchaeota archaeon]|nr:threonine--tRNA ligase [Candidatus Woesearchaeota archaeon]
MKILTIHADFIEFEAKKKALKDAEEVKKGRERIEECLVVFSAVQKRDEEDLAGVTQRYVTEINDIARQVNTKTIVLYPYAHLSSDLAAPAKAEKVLKDAEEVLKKEKFIVHRAPFGWYKSFNLSCKGHPLSELSREFTAEGKAEAGKGKEEVSEAVKAEAKLVSHWHILDLDGKLHSISYDKEKRKFAGFDFKKYPQLQQFAAYELAKNRVAQQEPPHVTYMKKLELVDYEPGSDPGNLRFYPKGRFIKGLIEKYVTQKVKDYGGMEIEAPIMYDYEHPSLKSYLNRFPARQYAIQTPNKKVFLRFAACFGQFLMAHDAQISYKQLPVKLYELTRYSFRVEQHGELTGLRRLRAFTMPDCHAFVADLKQAQEEMLRRFELSRQVQEGFGFTLPDELEFAIRVTKEFYEQNKSFVSSLVKKWGKPTLIEMWEQRFFYFTMKYEWNFVDALEKCSALTTDQVDVENAERYGITYVDEKNQKQFPLILHCSPSGAVERVMYALLEKAAKDEKAGKVPMLPLWLSPTQVRLIPVSIDRHLHFCEGLTAELEKLGLRADIDDRVETVGKRIRSAAQEWIPYTLVVGDEEINDKFKQVVVRDREKNTEEKMRFDQLIDLLKKKTKDMPTDTLPLPRLVSRRIIFVG